MSPSVLIIGGGMAGLTAGCFAKMNGFQAEIFEMHSIPGGLCTAWNRKGYTFDLCVHLLIGTKPGTALYALYDKLGLIEGRKYIQPEYWMKIIDPEGDEVTLYNDPDRLYAELVRISPEDTGFIRSLCNDIKKLVKMEQKVDPCLVDMIRLMPYYVLMNKYKLSPNKALKGIKNPKLRRALISGLDWEGQSLIFPLMLLSLQGSGNGSYPLGGSVPLAKALEKKFKELGGTISYNQKVVSILTKESRAVGVRLSDGTERYGDCVISCADGHSTIFDWLGGMYCDDTIREYYQNLKPFPSIVFIALGINSQVPSIPEMCSIILDSPVHIGGQIQENIVIRNHAHDPFLVPEGKGIITLWVPVNYEWWEQFPYQGEEYQNEKEKVSQQVINLLIERFPELYNRIEVVDVATPMTFVRYTGNWRGSYEGWLITPDSFFLELPMTLPGLSRFYMAGQWVSTGGGIPGAILSGRTAIKKICREMKIPFKG